MAICSNRAGYFQEKWDETYRFCKYYAFTPTPICEINVKIDDELCMLLANAQRLLGLLEGSCRYVYDIKNFTSLLIIKEASASCKIDNTVSYSELDLFIPPKHKNEQLQPINNYINALNFARDDLNSIPLTNKVIFTTHEMLLAHKSNVEIVGAVRKKQSYIGDIRVGSIGGPPDYNPPQPEKLNSCMEGIQCFMKKRDAVDILIKTALLHYQLEVVHPFESGNGKIGRILISLYLYHNGILKQSLLPISEFFEMNKVEYFDRIKAVHNFGEYEQWVKFFLRAISKTASLCLQRIDKFIQYREEMTIKFNSYDKDSKYLSEVFRYIEEHIFLTIDSLADGINVSYNTAARIVGILEELKILKLLKKQARNRVYFYFDLLESMGFKIYV